MHVHPMVGLAAMQVQVAGAHPGVDVARAVGGQAVPHVVAAQVEGERRT